MYTIGFSFSGEFPRKMIHVFQVRFSHNKQTFKHAYTFVTFRFFVCIQLKSKLSLSACFVLFLSTQHALLHDVFSLLQYAILIPYKLLVLTTLCLLSSLSLSLFICCLFCLPFFRFILSIRIILLFFFAVVPYGCVCVCGCFSLRISFFLFNLQSA